MTFHEITTPRAHEGGTFQFHVPDGWQQGRGAFGGLVIAYLARAVESFIGQPDRKLRSLTGEICGPVTPGEIEVKVEVLRAGNAVTTSAARLVQAGEVQAHAVIVSGRDRDAAADWNELPIPAAPDWHSLPPRPGNFVPPPFAQHFSLQPFDHLPFSSGPAAIAHGWVRMLDPGPERDSAFLIAHADAFWPAAFTRMGTPRPMSTIGFTLQIVGDVSGLDPAAPFLHTARMPVCTGGYGVEFRELRGSDGRLLALNQQTFVVIK